MLHNFQIKEFLEIGMIKEAEIIEEDQKIKVLSMFCDIHGVGPSTANQLYNMGFRNLKDIEHVSLHKDQAIGVKYYDDFLVP